MFRWLYLPLLVALMLSACSVSDDFIADGDLDCDSETTWSEQGTVADDAQGLPTAEEAVAQYLVHRSANTLTFQRPLTPLDCVLVLAER